MSSVSCDSSTLITLADNCLLWLIREFSDRGTDFYITPRVKEESIDHPLQINRFEFEAYRLEKLIEDGYIKVVPQDQGMKDAAKMILDLANRSYISRHGPLRLIHDGEAEVLALSETTNKMVAVDEKTTRLIIEDPKRLRDILEKKTEEKISVDGQILRKLQDKIGDIKIIRSAEIAAIGYERGLLERYGKGRKILNAILWALRKGGCAITREEIEQLSV